MRYQESGEVHLDFHRVTNGTIAYLRENHGREFVDLTFRQTARAVYRDVHDHLQRGDPEQLVQHWTYFFDREGGRYTLERGADAIKFTVHECPAIAWLRKNNIAVDPDFCRQTVVVNATLGEGTPFEISTEVLGGGRCVQIIRRIKR